MTIVRINQELTCYRCGSTDIRSSARADYCGKCGEILEEYPW